MEIKERWKYIEGYEGLYQVSDQGRIKSVSRITDHKQPLKEKIRKLYQEPEKYVKVVLCKNGKKKTYNVHTLVAKAFLENPKNLKEINHLDEDKANNHFSNLEWTSRAENLIYSLGGERHPFAKLTDKEVQYIKENYKPRSRGKFGSLALSKKFKVSKVHIQQIFNGTTRKNKTRA